MPFRQSSTRAAFLSSRASPVTDETGPGRSVSIFRHRNLTLDAVRSHPCRQRAVDVGFRSDMSGSADTPQETAELPQQGFQDHDYRKVSGSTDLQFPGSCISQAVATASLLLCMTSCFPRQPWADRRIRFTRPPQCADAKTQRINEANPVSVTVDGQGVAVTATVNTTALNNIVQKFAVTKAEDDALDSAASPSRRRNSWLQCSRRRPGSCGSPGPANSTPAPPRARLPSARLSACRKPSSVFSAPAQTATHDTPQSSNATGTVGAALFCLVNCATRPCTPPTNGFTFAANSASRFAFAGNRSMRRPMAFRYRGR